MGIFNKVLKEVKDWLDGRNDPQPAWIPVKKHAKSPPVKKPSR